ncbi:trypsin domain-containing protein [Ditylenchus destructor]|nr:trypsin domain-containing protein [Ditylenchus destructor]
MEFLFEKLSHNELEDVRNRCWRKSAGDFTEPMIDIKNGDLVAPGTYPFIGALKRSDGGQCTAFIFYLRFVATNRHCVEDLSGPEDAKLFLGGTCFGNECKEEERMFSAPWKFIVFDNYFLNVRDIAIMELGDIPTSLKSKIQYACIEPNEMPSTIIAAGFGLLKSKMPTNMLHQAVLTATYQNEQPTMIIPQNEREQVTMKGDSGAPLFRVDSSGTAYVIGINRGINVAENVAYGLRLSWYMKMFCDYMNLCVEGTVYLYSSQTTFLIELQI